MPIAQLKTFASFGLILGASLNNGRIAQRLKLPSITGFLLTGLLAGPWVLGMLNSDQVTSLQPIDHISLSFIALVAGSELKLSDLKAQLRATLSVMLGLTLATFTLTSLTAYLLSPWIPVLGQSTSVELICAAVLLGVIMVARSPSAAIAMIGELKAKGPFTQLILGVTVLMDVVVITLFAAALSLSKSLTLGQAISFDFIKGIMGELTLSAGIGSLLFLMLRHVLRAPLPKLIRAISLLSLSAGTFYLSESLHHSEFTIAGISPHFDPLLACLITGMWIKNAQSGETASLHRFEAHVAELSPWIYLVFFTVTGASLKLDLLAVVWPLALVFFVIRLLGLGIGATLGGVISGEPSQQHSYRWMGFVTQAGVGLGLAKRVATEFPSWGPSLATLIIGVIVMNELLGPLFFKRAIIRSGEAQQESEGDSLDRNTSSKVKLPSCAETIKG